MDDDTTRPDDQDNTLPAPDRKALLIILGGFGLAALILAVAAKRVSQRPTGVIVDGDWQASLEHLAGAFEVRLQGIEGALAEAANDRVARAAAMSTPPTPLVPAADTGNGDHAVAPVDDAVGAVPPAPAAVSLPDRVS